MTMDLLPQVSGHPAGSSRGEKPNPTATSAAETNDADAAAGAESREPTPAFGGLLAALVAAATSAGRGAGGATTASGAGAGAGAGAGENPDGNPVANPGADPSVGGGVLPSGKMIVLAAAFPGGASGSDVPGGHAVAASAGEGDGHAPGTSRPAGLVPPASSATATMSHGTSPTPGKGGDDSGGLSGSMTTTPGDGESGGVPNDTTGAQPAPAAADGTASPAADGEQPYGATSRRSEGATGPAGAPPPETSGAAGAARAQTTTSTVATAGAAAGTVGTAGGLELDGAGLARPMADATLRADGSPVANPRVTDQVARGLLTRGGGLAGNDTVTLQLEPEHLGRVEVRVVAREGRLEVTFTTETAEAGRALREGAQDLARTLGNRGESRWQAIDVKVAEPGSDQRTRDQGGRERSDADEDHESPARDQSRDQQQSDRRRDRREDT